jgi:hypothetical protein
MKDWASTLCAKCSVSIHGGFGDLADLMAAGQYKKGSNETPLHALQTVAGPGSVQKILGRYWVRPWKHSTIPDLTFVGENGLC